MVDDRMKRGYCRGCGERVEITVPPDGHDRAVHGKHGPNGECLDCPQRVLCGPVDPDPDDETADDNGDSMRCSC